MGRAAAGAHVGHVLKQEIRGFFSHYHLFALPLISHQGSVIASQPLCQQAFYCQLSQTRLDDMDIGYFVL